MVAIPLSSFLGSPMSRAVLLRVPALFLLPNGPQRAGWLVRTRAAAQHGVRD